MSYIFNNKIRYEDTAQLDALGRLRSSGFQLEFDSSLKNNDEAVLWSTRTEGSGSTSYDGIRRVVELSVSGTGDKAFRQTKQYFQYKTGISHTSLFCANMKYSGSSGFVSRAGFFYEDNGVYIGYSDSGWFIGVRSNISGTVDDAIIPSDFWNIDKMDGSGPSGITLDPEALQVFYLDFSWTGVGRIRVGAFIGGKMILFHELDSSNERKDNFLGTPSLPCRYEIESTGGSGTMTQQASCVLVEIAGDVDKRGLVRSVDTGVNTKPVSQSADTFVLGVRLKSGFERSRLESLSANMIQSSNNNLIYYKVIIQPTYSGGTWTDIGTNSIAEFSTNVTSFSGGIVINSGYIPTGRTSNVSVDLSSIVPITSDIDGNRDLLMIVARGVDGNNIPVLAALKFKEIY